MALRKAGVSPEVLEAAKVAAENAPASRVIAPVEPRDPEVVGKVRMNAIVAGYEVAAQLAATIAAGPDTVKTELHKLAKEVASQIETYTFEGF